MLKTDVLLNIFVENVIFFFFLLDSLMNGKHKRTTFIWNDIFCNIINVFTVTFEQFNASLLNNSINFLFKKKIFLTPTF